MSDAISSFGTLLQLGDGATPTEVFTTIAEVRDISGPALEATEHDVTSHSSSGAYGESIPGRLDAGELSFEINYVPTEGTHDATTGLLDEFVNRRRSNYKLVFPDGGSTTWQFSAYVRRFEPLAPVDGVLRANVTIRIVGQPTLA